MRLIDADKLKVDYLVPSTTTNSACYPYVSYFQIEDAPTVDAEPIRHGHWKEVQRIHETDHTAICECSLCGDTVWVYDGQRAWNYCPRCGARMEEVRDETD